MTDHPAAQPETSATPTRRRRSGLRGALLAAAAALIITASDSSAEDLPPIDFSNVSDTTISLLWLPVPDASSYMIKWWPQGNPLVGEYGVTAGATVYQIKGAAPLTRYVIEVQPMGTQPYAKLGPVTVTTLRSAPAQALIEHVVDCTQGPDNDQCDYDADDDGLIEVATLAQLYAIRHDLDGNGAPDVYPLPPISKAPPAFKQRIAKFYGLPWYRVPLPSEAPSDFNDGPHQAGVWGWEHRSQVIQYLYLPGDYTDQQRVDLYAAAFPDAEDRMGCYDTDDGGMSIAPSDCRGYELAAELDFDENGDGLRNDAYNQGAGWRPIMGRTYDGWHDYTHGRFYNVGPSHLRYARSSFNLAKMFRAVFEGNGHTITNLYINRPLGFNVGLFGAVGPGAELRNVGLISPYARGQWRVGTLAGYLQEALVSGAFARNVDVEGDRRAGGLLGYLFKAVNGSGGRVEESYATGRVHGNSEVGGLSGGLVLGSADGFHHGFASMHVTCGGECSAVGGLSGYVLATPINDAYVTGAVRRSTGNPTPDLKSQIGGLYGLATARRNQITNTYAATAVSGSPGDRVHGMLPYCRFKPVSGVPEPWFSYWNSELSTTANSGCIADQYYISSKTTAELTAPTDATAGDSTGLYPTWSTDVWDFGTSSEYPILRYCGTKSEIDLSWDPNRTDYCPLRETEQWGRAPTAPPP